MIDVDLIQQCADPRIEVAVVRQFVAEMNAPDHLTIRVFQGDKMVLVPAPKSASSARSGGTQPVELEGDSVALHENSITPVPLRCYGPPLTGWLESPPARGGLFATRYPIISC